MHAIVRPCEAPDTDALDEGLVEEHHNATRTIYELSEDGLRRTRLDFHLTGAPAGDHNHTGDEGFKGRGLGTLYTRPKDAPAGTKPDEQQLPSGWWTVDIPAGLSHTFVFEEPIDEPPTDAAGRPVVAVLYSWSNFAFENGVNTFPDKLTDLAKVV